MEFVRRSCWRNLGGNLILNGRRIYIYIERFFDCIGWQRRGEGRGGGGGGKWLSSGCVHFFTSLRMSNWQECLPDFLLCCLLCCLLCLG